MPAGSPSDLKVFQSDPGDFAHLSSGVSVINSRTKSKTAKRQVIVKKIRRVAHGRPLGSWKIAYADFVTALMAFFLLMWLTSVVPQNDLLQIAEYFKTPLQVVLSGGQSQDASTSLISGSYGDDKTKSSGQVRAGQEPTAHVILAERDVKRLQRMEELGRLQLLKRQLERLIEADAKLGKFKNQLLIDLTSEGLRILIVDEQNSKAALIFGQMVHDFRIAN